VTISVYSNACLVSSRQKKRQLWSDQSIIGAIANSLLIVVPSTVVKSGCCCKLRTKGPAPAQKSPDRQYAVKPDQYRVNVQTAVVV